MMNIAAPKKRKFLEKPKKLNGIFDSASNDEIACLQIQNAALGVPDGLIITRELSNLFIKSIGVTEITEQLRKVTDRATAVATLCREKGCILAEEGKMNEALTKWQEGLFFCPNDHLLHELTAQGLLSLDRNLLALKSALRAVDICPDWTEGLLTLARTQREIGELEASRETYSRVLEVDKRNAIAIQELKDLEPLLLQLCRRKRELMENVQSSCTPDDIEANTCILNLSTRVRVEWSRLYANFTLTFTLGFTWRSDMDLKVSWELLEWLLLSMQRPGLEWPSTSWCPWQ